MREYFVYILKCSDGSYYTGVTNNYEKRLLDHQNGLNPKAYTYRRRPVTLMYVAMFEDIHDAITAEKHIKGWSRKKKEALILNDSDERNETLHKLAECQNETHHKFFHNKKG